MADKTRGLPPQWFDKNFIAYVKTLEIRAKNELGIQYDECKFFDDTLINKMIEIEKRDKKDDR